jgi:hypothetical protein
MDHCAPMLDIVLSRGAEPPLVQKKRQYSVNVIKTPYFPEYCKIVADYTSRVMSFQTDRLAGMQGILNSLSRAYDLEFVQGIPESIFDASLLWQPRQDPQRVKIDENTGRHLFPSWSWAGWIELLNTRISITSMASQV